MQSPAQQQPAPAAQVGGDFSFTVMSSSTGVRTAIDRVSDLLTPHAISPDDMMAVELTLAEILNNVVEHAYEYEEDGEIEMTVSIDLPDVRFLIVDFGHHMPNGRLPSGRQADVDLPAHEQAEGGYGLHLIRQMARKLRYRRIDDQNEISFRMTFGKPLHRL